MVVALPVFLAATVATGLVTYGELSKGPLALNDALDRSSAAAIDLDQCRERARYYRYVVHFQPGTGADRAVERGDQMDVYQILLQDHQTLRQIFTKIDKSNISEVGQREQLFKILQNDLEAHEILEETIFYPEIDKYPDARELIGVALDEHAEFDAILQEISELPADKPEWLERITELKDLLQQHVYSEENKMFPAARKVLDERRAEELGRQIEELKQKESS